MKIIGANFFGDKQLHVNKLEYKIIKKALKKKYKKALRKKLKAKGLL